MQGNAATGGFCSKCWGDEQKTKAAVASAAVPPPSPEVCTNIVEKVAPFAVEVKATVSVESSTTTPKSSTTVATTAITETPAITESAQASVANAPAKKKKKKKTSYKNMMASMMKELARDPAEKDSAKDDAIRKVTGGGAFSKIDRI